MERDDGPDNVVLGPKDAVVMNGFVNDSSLVNLVEDNSHVVIVIQPINFLVNDESLETSKALLKATTGAELDGGRITISSVDGSRLFSLERPAGSGFPFHSSRPAPPPYMLKCTLSEEEEKILEKIHNIRVKFLTLVQ
ncbi:hypothetical protein NC653_022137 [Populus alba x Populus x berolinensis]|uniref:Uncharacterized protein n=2 Tax=Populus TaxID=3689 RepID=A0A4U5PNV2_POPAL|nr:hypothetical protein NC653_022137 [Populus alba x Populus x berolinensis]TKR98091.1 hypothetical protein D5086_0000206390 [Populus alba]